MPGVMASALTGLLLAGCAAGGAAPTPSPRPHTTFVLRPGQTLTIQRNSWRAGDRVTCPNHGGAAIPPVGLGVGDSLGVDVQTQGDGTVVAHCDAGPPPDA